MDQAIFEEGEEDVGSDIEAYCPKCKGDTAHTVITKYEDEIRRVQCNPCGDVHAYRKPRGEAEEEVPEPVAAKKRAMLKKPTWQEARDRAGDKKIALARPYSIRDTYSEGDIVTHPKFGVGFVTETSENKVEITFQDERRLLVHNRPDLASQMPAIASIPAPREEKVGKGRKGKKKMEPPPPLPTGKGGEIKRDHTAVVSTSPAATASKPIDAKAKAAASARPVAGASPAGKAAASAKPVAASAKPVAAAKSTPAKPIQAKVDRVKAAVAKKASAANAKAKTSAKPIKTAAKKIAKVAKAVAKAVRPAPRPAKPAAKSAKPANKAKKAR